MLVTRRRRTGPGSGRGTGRGLVLTRETSAAPRDVSRNSRWNTMRLGLFVSIASTARSASVSAKTMICRPTPGSPLSVVTAVAPAITTTGGSAIRSSLSADPAVDSKWAVLARCRNRGDPPASAWVFRHITARGRCQKPRYLLQACYMAQGASGALKKGGSQRRAAVEQLMIDLRIARGAGHQPTAEPETSGARIWCTATRLRIAAGPCTALVERLD